MSFGRMDGMGRGFGRLGSPLGGAAGPAAFVLPTPSFGSTNLLGWWDIGKTYTDSDGASQAAIAYDSVGYDSVSWLADLSGNGNDWLQGAKDLQPTKGPNNGPMFDSNAVYMECIRKSMLAGLSKISIYAMARPLAGTGKRTLFNISEGTSTVAALTASVASGGTGYVVDEYITLTGGTGTNTVLKVSSVSGGAVTGVTIAVGGNYSVTPTDPVSQGSTTGSGTGATFNMTFAIAGGGGTVERLAYYSSAGNTGRKGSITSSVSDGAQNSTSTSNGTSWGAPNGAALTDTTTFHRLGVEIDLTGASAVADFYMDGVHDGTQQTWTPVESSPWTFNSTDAVTFRLGNNNALNAALFGELTRMVMLSEVPDSSRRTLIDNYLTSGT